MVTEIDEDCELCRILDGNGNEVSEMKSQGRQDVYCSLCGNPYFSDKCVHIAGCKAHTTRGRF